MKRKSARSLVTGADATDVDLTGRPPSKVDLTGRHDPHPEHTTRFIDRPDLVLPREALAVIDKQWPEIVRTFQQYDEGAGMLMLYGCARDASRAAGWPDSEVYKIRDFLISKANAAKIRTYTGTDTTPGDWSIFKMRSTESVVTAQRMNAKKVITEGGHKAGCTCGFCKNKGSLGKKKDEKADKAEDKATKTESRATRIVTKMLDS